MLLHFQHHLFTALNIEFECTWWKPDATKSYIQNNTAALSKKKLLSSMHQHKIDWTIITGSHIEDKFKTLKTLNFQFKKKTISI